MTARAPASYTTYVDEDGLIPRQPVVKTSPFNVINDQCYIHQKPDLLVSDKFPVYGGDAGAGVVQLLAPYYVTLDLCGVAATKACVFTIQCESLVGVTDFSVGIYNATTTTQYSYTVTANHQTRLWRAYTAMTIQADGTEQELWLTYADPDAAYVSITGVGIFMS